MKRKFEAKKLSIEELEQEKCLQQKILDEILEDTESRALEKVALFQPLADEDKEVDTETQRKLDGILLAICQKDMDAALYAANIVTCFHHAKNVLGGPSIETICKEKITEYIKAKDQSNNPQLESAAKAYALLLLTGDHNLGAYIGDIIYQDAKDLLEVNITELHETVRNIQESAYPYLTSELDRITNELTLCI